MKDFRFSILNNLGLSVCWSQEYICWGWPPIHIDHNMLIWCGMVNMIIPPASMAIMGITVSTGFVNERWAWLCSSCRWITGASDDLNYCRVGEVWEHADSWASCHFTIYHNMEILKQHLKRLERKVNLSKRVLNRDNDSKHSTKVFLTWLQNRVRPIKPT